MGVKELNDHDGDNNKDNHSLSLTNVMHLDGAK